MSTIPPSGVATDRGFTYIGPRGREHTTGRFPFCALTSKIMVSFMVIEWTTMRLSKIFSANSPLQFNWRTVDGVKLNELAGSAVNNGGGIVLYLRVTVSRVIMYISISVEFEFSPTWIQ